MRPGLCQSQTRTVKVSHSTGHSSIDHSWLEAHDCVSGKTNGNVVSAVASGIGKGANNDVDATGLFILELVSRRGRGQDADSGKLVGPAEEPVNQRAADRSRSTNNDDGWL